MKHFLIPAGRIRRLCSELNEFSLVKKSIFWALLFISLFFQFAPLIFHFHFLSDDYGNISASVRNHLPLTSDFRGWSNGVYFRPLSTFSWYFNFFIGGFNPFGFFLMNIVLSIFNGILILIILKKIINFNLFGGLIVLSVFYCVPQTLSNVYWISGRTDLLALTFTLLTTLFGLKYLELNKLQFLFASLLSLILGLAAKETALLSTFYVLSIVFFNYLANNKRFAFRNLLFIFSGLTATSVFYFIFRKHIFGVYFSADNGFLQKNFDNFSMWLFSGLLSIYIPFDLVDLSSILYESQILYCLFIILTITLLFIFIKVILELSAKIRYQFLFLIAVSAFSLAIYIHTISQIRLAYFTMPFLLGLILLIFTNTKNSVWVNTFLVIFFILLIPSAGSQVLKHYNISVIQRKIENTINHNSISSDTLYVLGQIGRVGQTWVSSADAFLLPPATVTLRKERKKINVIFLPTFECHAFTSLYTPYSIKFKSDTLILVSNSLKSGFVPLTAYKYFEKIPYIQNGLTHLPVSFIEKRKGIAKIVKVYPIPETNAPAIYFEKGEFKVAPLSKLKLNFSIN